MTTGVAVVNPPIIIHPDIEDALQRGAPVVALESAVITSGLPREPLADDIATKLHDSPRQSRGLTDFDRTVPVNLELGRAMQRAVRAAGATPATIAILHGELRIGLNDDELIALADERCAAKASASDMAHILATGGSAGTTVSATLAALSIVNRKSSIVNPFVFATGGIGGVHRNWQTSPDVSADLRQIANTPVCIVCSGAKSILDLPATLEMLETLGVPVIGFRTHQFPQFLSPGTNELRLSKSINTARDAATLCDLQWNALRLQSGVLLCNPPPDEFAIDADELETAIAQSESNASAQRIAGAARTPFLLSELARLTAGRSLLANLTLLVNNARLAAEVAVEMASLSR